MNVARCGGCRCTGSYGFLNSNGIVSFTISFCTKGFWCCGVGVGSGEVEGGEEEMEHCHGKLNKGPLKVIVIRKICTRNGLELLF